MEVFSTIRVSRHSKTCVSKTGTPVAVKLTFLVLDAHASDWRETLTIRLHLDVRYFPQHDSNK